MSKFEDAKELIIETKELMIAKKMRPDFIKDFIDKTIKGLAEEWNLTEEEVSKLKIIDYERS